MKKGERKNPDIYYDPLARLSPDEKARLRQILVDPVYVKLLRVVEGMKPSSNCSKAGTGERDAFSNERANARLGEIRGWELHIAAIFRALTDAPPIQTETDTSFPDSGMLSIVPRTPAK